MIMAGGSGTRLWPMSKGKQPKQLIPFIGGRSLLQIAFDRIEGLVPGDRRYICAGDSHRAPILEALKGFDESRYLGEPMGRDTLNAVGYAAAVIAQRDPEASIAVFTADHIIEPVDQFRAIVERGFSIVEKHPDALVTFGIAPTHAATAYGYLQLGSVIDGGGAFIVDQFREKPPAPVASEYFAAGATRYLWNSGMFVWRAKTLLDCIARYRPENHAGLLQIAQSWGKPEQAATLAKVYPALGKVSVDYAVMEPASKDPKVKVIAVPMPLTWLDVGSWPAFAETCEQDEQGNAKGGGKHLLMNTHKTLVASSDPNHLIATLGCDNLIIIHTPQATLVCHKDQAESIKNLHAKVGETFGSEWV